MADDVPPALRQRFVGGLNIIAADHSRFGDCGITTCADPDTQRANLRIKRRIGDALTDLLGQCHHAVGISIWQDQREFFATVAADMVTGPLQ